jgi:hypothetical protein
MALEIMEQTSEKIVARDFVNMGKVNMINLIHKIDIIARSMMDDLKFSGSVPHENIADRDEDVNRITFLLFRSIKYAFNNPSMMKEYKTNSIQLLICWAVVSAIEQLSDQIKRLARYCDNLNLQKDLQDELTKVLNDVKKAFTTIMSSYYSNDRITAYKVAMIKGQILKKCDELYDKHWKKEPVPNLIEKLRNMALEVHNITRTVYS